MKNEEINIETMIELLEDAKSEKIGKIKEFESIFAETQQIFDISKSQFKNDLELNRNKIEIETYHYNQMLNDLEAESSQIREKMKIALDTIPMLRKRLSIYTRYKEAFQKEEKTPVENDEEEMNLIINTLSNKLSLFKNKLERVYHESKTLRNTIGTISNQCISVSSDKAITNTQIFEKQNEIQSQIECHTIGVSSIEAQICIAKESFNHNILKQTEFAEQIITHKRIIQTLKQRIAKFIDTPEVFEKQKFLKDRIQELACLKEETQQFLDKKWNLKYFKSVQMFKDIELLTETHTQLLVTKKTIESIQNHKVILMENEKEIESQLYLLDSKIEKTNFAHEILLETESEIIDLEKKEQENDLNLSNQCEILDELYETIAASDIIVQKPTLSITYENHVSEKSKKLVRAKRLVKKLKKMYLKALKNHSNLKEQIDKTVFVSRSLNEANHCINAQRMINKIKQEQMTSQRLFRVHDRIEKILDKAKTIQNHNYL